MNVITKKVTSWAAIIAVPTFITGCYGMNVPYPGFSRPAGFVAAIAIMALAAWLPFSPAAPALGFTALPLLYWPILLATLLCYVVLTQTVKMWLIRKAWL